eukprot:7562453-Pyramimonas_sp.AAC.1
MMSQRTMMSRFCAAVISQHSKLNIHPMQLLQGNRLSFSKLTSRWHHFAADVQLACKLWQEREEHERGPRGCWSLHI